MADIRPGIIKLGDREYATWPYVLDKAHSKGLKGIACEIVQIPTKENGMLAIVKAIAHFEDCTFSALGDASPENTGPKIAKHIVRMAETRAKGRALRDALNIGMTLQEELGEDDDALPARPSVARSVGQTPVVLKQAKVESEPFLCCQCNKVVEDGKARKSLDLTGMVLCGPHGREWVETQGAAQVARVPTGAVVG